MTEIEILQHALSWRTSGREVALCTVVETWGSAPKPVGSHLIVDGDGAFFGSVSGGCVEADIIVEAVDAARSGKSRMSEPRILEFGVSDGLAWKAGLTCGGRINVLVERIDETLASCLTRIVHDYAEAKPTILVTALDGGRPQVIGLDERAAQPVPSQVVDAFRRGKSRLVEDGDLRVFLTVSMPATRLIVVGAVHIAQSLTPIAKIADLEMTVVDPRSAFATPDRFPGVRLIADWPHDVAASIGLARTDAFVTLSHDPKIDDQGLGLALQAGCFYVGALGSRQSHARRLDRLRAAGIAEPDLRRVHAPIGLDIGAEGPAEIAVAIVAEIISVRRGRPVAAAAFAAA